MKSVRKTAAQQPQPQQENSELRPGAEKAITRAELSALHEKIAELIAKNPQKAATILAHWLNQPPGALKTPANTVKKPK